MRAGDPGRPARDGGPPRGFHRLGRDSPRRRGPCEAHGGVAARARRRGSMRRGLIRAPREGRRPWSEDDPRPRCPPVGRRARAGGASRSLDRPQPAQQPPERGRVRGPEDSRPARRAGNGRHGCRPLHGGARRTPACPRGLRTRGRHRRRRPPREQPAPSRRVPRAPPGGLDRPRLRPAHAALRLEPRGARPLRPRLAPRPRRRRERRGDRRGPEAGARGRRPYSRPCREEAARLWRRMA